MMIALPLLAIWIWFESLLSADTQINTQILHSSWIKIDYVSDRQMFSRGLITIGTSFTSNFCLYHVIFRSNTTMTATITTFVCGNIVDRESIANALLAVKSCLLCVLMCNTFYNVQWLWVLWLWDYGMYCLGGVELQESCVMEIQSGSTADKL